MYTKNYLTRFDLQELDPLGNLTKTVNAFKGVSRLMPEKPSQFIRITPDEMLGRYQDMLANRRQAMNSSHAPYWEYNQDLISKWGPQGGLFPWELMVDSIHESYLNAEQPHTITEPLRVGRDILLRTIKQLIERVGYPQELPISVYRTNAAAPTGLKKGSYHAETYQAKPGWRHVAPDLLGQRYMRGKTRVIHQDSILNVRYVERTLSKVRHWLRTYLPEYFSGWLNPKAWLRPRISRLVARPFASIETDFSKMDEHFSYDVARELILPVYELLLDEGEFLHLASYIEESYRQPIFMGSYLLEGLHNLFSGQPPTNDFETIFGVELSLGSLGINDIPNDYADIFANGDDIALILHNKVYMRKQSSVMNTMIEASNAAGLLMSSEKCRIDSKSIRFCRQVYYPAGRRDPDGVLYGAYPTVLALNNIVQPERPVNQPGIAAIADLQRLDNCYGSPDYDVVSNLVYRFCTHKFRFAAIDLEQAPVDWWEKVYGEKWDPTSSPTFLKFRHLSK